MAKYTLTNDEQARLDLLKKDFVPGKNIDSYGLLRALLDRIQNSKEKEKK